MLQLFNAKSYQDRVDNMYRLLNDDSECSLELFEWRVRKIHILNMKIKLRAADLGRKKEIY